MVCVAFWEEVFANIGEGTSTVRVDDREIGKVGGFVSISMEEWNGFVGDLSKSTLDFSSDTC